MPAPIDCEWSLFWKALKRGKECSSRCIVRNHPFSLGSGLQILINIPAKKPRLQQRHASDFLR
jgi:hypothetical protein